MKKLLFFTTLVLYFNCSASGVATAAGRSIVQTGRQVVQAAKPVVQQAAQALGKSAVKVGQKAGEVVARGGEQLEASVSKHAEQRVKDATEFVADVFDLDSRLGSLKKPDSRASVLKKPISGAMKSLGVHSPWSQKPASLQSVPKTPEPHTPTPARQSPLLQPSISRSSGIVSVLHETTEPHVFRRPVSPTYRPFAE